ncbi:DNA glycosylase superfamily protein [Abeliophyllum distichum]|uniref:DNA glycosylase superfamily protein n=1 Tax=Abeliophyllum distichum TaxID=126358 RepID=A0ABD1V5S6_9LAMI
MDLFDYLSCKGVSIPGYNPETQSQDEIRAYTDKFLQNSQNHSNPSKIPIRPQKIRKLSSTSTDTTPTANKESPPPQITVDDSSSNSIVEAPATTITTKNRLQSASQLSRLLPQIIKPLSVNGKIELAIRHLRSVDSLLVSLIDTHLSPQFESHQSPCLALTKSILYQQLAYKAGATIYTRFVVLCGGEDPISVQILMDCLFNFGDRSGMKANALKPALYTAELLLFFGLNNRRNEIGRWTKICYKSCCKSELTADFG